MWPLFDVARWGEWRASVLGVSVLPYLDCHPRRPLPLAPPLLYAFSDQVLPRPGMTPRRARVQARSSRL
jgi:hypothetical protein